MLSAGLIADIGCCLWQGVAVSGLREMVFLEHHTYIHMKNTQMHFYEINNVKWLWPGREDLVSNK